jgi:hypothetical protein
MARDTQHRIKIVDIEEGTTSRVTRGVEGRRGVIAWTPDKVIYLAQINNKHRTSTPSINTLETVDADHMGTYLQSMLDNGWVLSDSLADERNDI